VQIGALFAFDQPLAAIPEQVACLSTRLVLQTALEAEASAFLGRDRSQRDPPAWPGYRNGHQPVMVKATAGPVTLERPKLIAADPGEPAVAEARRRAEAVAARWGARYPSAVAGVPGTLPELTTHLRFPRERWARIRHANLIERTFGEARRAKVVGRLPGGRSCRGANQTPAGVRVLHRLRHQLLGGGRLAAPAAVATSAATAKGAA
jgi:transposase-like protein